MKNKSIIKSDSILVHKGHQHIDLRHYIEIVKSFYTPRNSLTKKIEQLYDNIEINDIEVFINRDRNSNGKTG